MSTWISDIGDAVPARGPHRPRVRTGRAALAAMLVGLLAGCAGLDDAATRATVGGGAITIAAPRGYCVDRSALRDGRRGAFVLFGSCAALAPGPFATEPDPLAVLTAAVAPPRAAEGAATGTGALTGRADRLAAYVTSPAGRRALSRDGRADSVTVLRTFTENGVFFIHLRDTSATAGPPVAAEYWRAILEVKQRMITLSILFPDGAAVDAEDGAAVIRAFAERVRDANMR